MRINPKILTKYVIIIILLHTIIETTMAIPEINNGILNELKNEEWVYVVVVLKANDKAGFNLIKENQENGRLLSEKDKENLVIQEDVLMPLLDSDFKLKSKSLTGRAFSGLISISGLNKLRTDPRIERIRKPVMGSIALSQSTDTINVNPEVWNLDIKGVKLKGDNQTVCVIDSGVDSTHPALSSKIIAQHCFCARGGTGCCPNNQVEDTNARDDLGHGTHVAGIVASNGSLQGVAPNAKLAVVRIMNITGNWHDDDLEKAIDWCRLNTAASVITMSLYTKDLAQDFYCSGDIVSSAAKKAHDAKIFISVSAGNDNRIGASFPACIPEVAPVGATTSLDSFWIWNETIGSNRGKIIDLVAPGHNIRSAASSNGTECNQSPVNGFAYCSGTSMATPHVAGAAAILYQLHSLKGINTNPDNIERILIKTGRSFYDGKTKKEYHRIDVYRAVTSLLGQTQNLTISNSGTEDLYVTAITDNETWLTEAPSEFLGTNRIKINDSRIVNVIIDTTTLPRGFYSTTININSNDPDESLVSVPVNMNFTGKINLNDKSVERYKKSRPYKGSAPVRSGGSPETDRLDFILDWAEQNVLNVTLTSPNGTNYTIGTVTEGFNFTDGHPKILSLKPPALQNGTWTIIVSPSALNTSGEGEFTLETRSFPSDTPPTTNFSEIRLNYINACSYNDNPGFRILMKGVENASLPTINTSNATDIASKAFLTGLVIPNDKLWLNLPRGQVLIDDNFAKTLTAHILLSSDVELKRSGKPEWVQVINNSYHYWNSIIQNTSYYSKVRNKTDWYYPDFTGQRFIIPKNFTLNGSGCDAFVEKLELSTISNITTAWVDYSDYGLNQSELDDVNNNKIPQFLTYINNKSNQLLVPALNTQVNNNATFAGMRRVIVSLGLSQWYKTLPRENLMFNEQIDSENLTIFKLNQSFNKTFWQQQSDQLLFTDNLNLPSGNFSFDWRGGLNLIKINASVIGNISPDLQQKLDDSLNKKRGDIYLNNITKSERGEML